MTENWNEINSHSAREERVGEFSDSGVAYSDESVIAGLHLVSVDRGHDDCSGKPAQYFIIISFE
jgi:hypothetical protein